MRLLLLSLLLLVGCTASSPADPTATPPPATPRAAEPQAQALAWPQGNTPPHPAPKPVTLPLDDGPHDAFTEWWYYNGHLEAEDGRRYGFELVVFKRQPRGGPAGYAAHVAVTDHRRRTFQFAEDISLPPPAANTGPGFDLSVGTIAAKGSGGHDTISGATTDYEFDLQLRPLKPPVIHGETGYIGVAASELSYYYSRTRMETSGILRERGTAVPVTGLAWMDHQWGDFSLQGGGGWDWYSVQLDGGAELMASVIRDPAGAVLLAYGTLVDPAGVSTHLPADQFRAIATGRWTSPASGATYPMGWEIHVPDRALTLRLDPVIPQQEMLTTASVNATYWEGQVVVFGLAAGEPVNGMGYVELTGYGPTGEPR